MWEGTNPKLALRITKTPKLEDLASEIVHPNRRSIWRSGVIPIQGGAAQTHLGQS